MKLLVVAFLFSLSAMASVTPEQMRDIREESVEVMMDLGADPRLNPRVTSVKVISQLGDRVKVKFSYVEDHFGKKTCTFYYDLKVETAIQGSGLCGL